MGAHPTSTQLRIGLTGGIASGKSTVADLFAAYGVAIIDADQVARNVVAPGTPALAQVVATFGPAVLDAQGALNRRQMREFIFADPAARARYEAILHPAIREEMAKREARATGPYRISVVPLLAEKGLASTFDYVLVVDCAEEEQLQRLQARDSIDRIQAQRILDAQATRTQRLSVANDVIVNSGQPAQLAEQVRRLHEKYLNAAARKR